MAEHPAQTEHEPTPVSLTAAFLRTWPLPALDESGDKNTRGSLLIVGGSLETPGAIILAALAAMRSGVGRLRIATIRSIAAQIGVAVPEARVVPLPETPGGNIAPSAVEQLAGLVNQAKAVLLGPGMLDTEAAQLLLERLVPQIEQPALVLDAGALTANTRQLRFARPGNVITTPHAGEMAQLSGRDKAAIEADPVGVVLRAAAETGAVFALKGATTWLANAKQELYQYKEGHVGLAMSGSGDTLSGMVAGLATRAASPIQAASWGVYLHGEAGNRLARRFGPVGFLARELPDQIPQILGEFES